MASYVRDLEPLADIHTHPALERVISLKPAVSSIQSQFVMCHNTFQNCSRGVTRFFKRRTINYYGPTFRVIRTKIHDVYPLWLIFIAL